jgi:hypothetical protein
MDGEYEWTKPNPYDENGHYCLSLRFGLTYASEPPYEILQKRHADPQSLSLEEEGRMAYFGIALVKLTDENDPDDKVGLEYVAKFFRYFCPWGENFKTFTPDLQKTLLSTYDPGTKLTSYTKLAIKFANCTRPD